MREVSWRGLPAWKLSAGPLIAHVGVIGGAILSFCRQGVEALWQPPWPAAPEPDPALHGPADGEGRLLAVAGGWMLCLDRFGPPLAGENRPFHGEAATRGWDLVAHTETSLVTTVGLLVAGLTLRREVRLAQGGLTVHTVVTAMDGQARDFDWCEHLTLGELWLDGTSVTAGIDRVDPPPEAARPPHPVTIADVLKPPLLRDPPRGDLWSGRVATARGWWSVEHPGLGQRLTATWDSAAFPWLVVWTEDRQRAGSPWLGRTRARGLELSSRPFPGVGLHPEPSHLERATRCRLPAGGTCETTVHLQWEALGRLT
jgi:hypothetical protein